MRRCLDEVDADVLVASRTHDAFCVEVPGRGLVVNPGALLGSDHESSERQQPRRG